MKRREAIAGVASLGVLGTGGALAVGGFPGFGSSNGSTEYPQLEEPATVETVELPWGDGEPITVPLADTVTVLEFWATSCSVCKDNLPDVTDAYERTGENVEFVSITPQDVVPSEEADRYDLTGEDVLAWWREHGGGKWPIGYGTFDVQLQLTAAVTPATAIIDADGVTRWTHKGRVETETLLDRIESAGGTVQ